MRVLIAGIRERGCVWPIGSYSQERRKDKVSRGIPYMTKVRNKGRLDEYAGALRYKEVSDTMWNVESKAQHVWFKYMEWSIWGNVGCGEQQNCHAWCVVGGVFLGARNSVTR